MVCNKKKFTAAYFTFYNFLIWSLILVTANDKYESGKLSVQYIQPAVTSIGIGNFWHNCNNPFNIANLSLKREKYHSTTSYQMIQESIFWKLFP